MSQVTKPLNVFLIDDDAIDVENIRRALRESTTPPQLSVAKDGQQALEMLEAGDVPRERLVILLDLNMPRMNGIEFLAKLRESKDFSLCPVVVLTTSDAERDKVRAYEHNVVGYILKPVTFASFVSHMATIEAYWRLQEFPATAPPPAERQPLRVVVIDDDEVDRMAARRVLGQLPTRVTIEEFNSGEAGLERLLAGDVDCVLLDYSLPGINGIEVLGQLDAVKVDLPVIMMTGLDRDEELVVEALRSGAYDYLSKSRLDAGTLWSKVRAVRRLHGARSQTRATQAELHSTITQLRQAVAARDGVLAVVSHDLRGPLNNIQLSLALLEAEDAGARRMAIDSIERAVARSNRLISDLLDVSQLESGRFELKLRPIDPGALAQSAIAEVAALARRHANELVLEVDDGLREVQGDRERLIQVLDNLLRNAIKYGPSASQIRVRVRASSPDYVEISVSDRGPGIDERDRGQVFERFWQAADRAKTSGSGLGLAIAKSLVEAHHGQIGVDQADEGGARFYFTLPHARPR